jgi:hypothetical protein
VSVPRDARYEAEIEREGVNVRVVVDIIGQHMHRDVDETSELASMAATRLASQVRESIARAQIPF